jgi:hypothetical protein
MSQNSSSIAFLLCTDEDDVFSRFNFPRPAPFGTRATGQNPPGEQGFFGEFSLTSPLDVNFDLMDGLFNTYLNAGVVEPWDMLEPSGDFPLPGTECQEPVLAELRRYISGSPTVLKLSTDQRLDVQVMLDDLFSTSRAQRFLGHYWNHWHRNCRIIHRPSFKSNISDKPLLAAMISIGAMYSPNEAERASASVILPHLESYVFSRLLIDEESESFAEPVGAENLAVLQAGLLVVISMFWTAGPNVKHRASTHRFSQLAGVSYTTIEIHLQRLNFTFTGCS